MKYVIQICFIVYITDVTLINVGCSTQRAPYSAEWTPMNSFAHMSPSQVKQTTRLARAGDVTAAEKLYMHYTFEGDNAGLSKSRFWLEWLANRGIPFAEFNYGKNLIDEAKGAQQAKRGLMWMQKAKRHGYVGGDDLIDTYEKEYEKLEKGNVTKGRKR